MSAWIWVVVVVLVLGAAFTVALVAGAARVERERRAAMLRHPSAPRFVFGSGPLAGVGLHTARPWVKR